MSKYYLILDYKCYSANAALFILLVLISYVILLMRSVWQRVTAGVCPVTASSAVVLRTQPRAVVRQQSYE